MLAYGDDLFFNKATSDRVKIILIFYFYALNKIYDSLDDRFNYLMIAATVILVLVKFF